MTKADSLIRMRLAVAAFLVSDLFFAACSTRDNLAPKVTAEGVRSIQLGMSVEEVKSRLGEPVATLPSRERSTVLQYASEPMTSIYPMLWVHAQDGRVIEVYAKRYKSWGFDDDGVYGLLGDARWEAPAFEALFAPR